MRRHRRAAAATLKGPHVAGLRDQGQEFTIDGEDIADLRVLEEHLGGVLRAWIAGRFARCGSWVAGLAIYGHLVAARAAGRARTGARRDAWRRAQGPGCHGGQIRSVCELW